MAKKWTTLRKVDTSQPEESDDNAEQKSVPPRTPRRRKLARREVGRGESSRVPSVAEPQQEEISVPEPEPVRPLDIEEPRILVVHDAAATYRLVEETFGNFTKAKVDSTPDILNAFELAIRRDYQLFIIALNLPGMSGALFYEMVARGCSAGLGKKKLAPAVVFIRDEDDPLPSDELLQDVRIKAVWTKPLNIERMLDSVSSVIQRCDPSG